MQKTQINFHAFSHFCKASFSQLAAQAYNIEEILRVGEANQARGALA
jgi:hypothetical protein